MEIVAGLMSTGFEVGISWAYAGVLRCLAVPDRGNVMSLAEEPLMGGGGCLQFSSLECVFINRPIKKYPPHSPIPNKLPVFPKELYSVPVLLKECC